MLQDVSCFYSGLQSPLPHFPVPWVTMRPVPTSGQVWTAVKPLAAEIWGLCGNGMQGPLPSLCLSVLFSQYSFYMPLLKSPICQVIVTTLQQKKAGHCSCCLPGYASYPSRAFGERLLDGTEDWSVLPNLKSTQNLRMWSYLKIRSLLK